MPVVRQAMLRQNGPVDELDVADCVQQLFFSQVTGDLMSVKGFQPSNVQPPPGAFDGPSTDDKTVADGQMSRVPPEELAPKQRLEYDFWQKYVSADFAFGASARNGNGLASRFDRAFGKSKNAKDPEGQKLYKDYTAFKGNDERMSEYRKNWGSRGCVALCRG